MWCCSEEFSAGTETGQVDADECEAICDVFVGEVAVADPAVRAWEVFDGFGALDAACYLVVLDRSC